MNEPTTKICPLLAAGDPEYTRISAQCKEGRCAWFHLEMDPESGSATGRCAVLEVASVLEAYSVGKEAPQ